MSRTCDLLPSQWLRSPWEAEPWLPKRGGARALETARSPGRRNAAGPQCPKRRGAPVAERGLRPRTRNGSTSSPPPPSQGAQ